MTMRTVPVEQLLEADLQGIGRSFDLTAEGPTSIFSEGPGCTDRYTAEPLLDGAGHLGMTTGGALPAEIARMERHLYTAEALFCAGRPIVLPVAAASEIPNAAEVRALLIESGQGIVLAPGVWHAPGLGLDSATAYHWFAAVDETVASAWVPLDGGAVRIGETEGRP